jgi:hypothetical protein
VKRGIDIVVINILLVKEKTVEMMVVEILMDVELVRLEKNVMEEFVNVVGSIQRLKNEFVKFVKIKKFVVLMLKNALKDWVVNLQIVMVKLVVVMELVEVVELVKKMKLVLMEFVNVEL